MGRWSPVHLCSAEQAAWREAGAEQLKGLQRCRPREGVQREQQRARQHIGSSLGGAVLISGADLRGLSATVGGLTAVQARFASLKPQDSSPLSNEIMVRVWRGRLQTTVLECVYAVASLSYNLMQQLVDSYIFAEESAMMLLQ